MSHKKPQPLIPARSNNRCPVCGEVSYSRGGVHPQCSVQRADEERNIRIKRKKATMKLEKPKSSATPWQRVCPKCKELQHVRKKICSCGHTFALRSPPSIS